MKSTFFILLISLALSSCTRISDFTLDPGYDYYPLKSGHTTVYEVDSVIYSPLLAGGKDTVRWELKTVIGDSFRDAEGRSAFFVDHYWRRRGEISWQRPKRGIVLNTGQRIEYQYNNIRLIPFVFPPQKGKSWSGTAFIPDNDTFEFYRNWKNTFLSVDEAFDLDNLHFEKSARVLEADDENLLEYRHSEARFAREVGLIERIQFNLRFVGSVIPNKPWEEKANNGYIMYQRLIRYE